MSNELERFRMIRDKKEDEYISLTNIRAAMEILNADKYGRNLQLIYPDDEEDGRLVLKTPSELIDAIDEDVGILQKDLTYLSAEVSKLETRVLKTRILKGRNSNAETV